MDWDRQMKELVVISGKGGTGKTSILASFAALSKRSVLADCDVDAADLFLLLTPDATEAETFKSGRQAVIVDEKCTGCGRCRQLCRFDAINEPDTPGGRVYTVDPAACEGCGVCVWACPAGAIEFPERICGELFVSTTRFGTMVHARLDIGAENSGKLVTLVRKTAARQAALLQADMVLIDGPPGIGCPAIASMTGASCVLVITEPTLSGQHDLARVLDLTTHFGVETYVCVNKYDINEEMTRRIEDMAVARGAEVFGRVRYDKAVTEAQLQGRAVVESSNSPAAQDIVHLWERVGRELGDAPGVKS